MSIADPGQGPDEAAVVPVAVGVLVRPDGSVLLARRPPGKVYEGYWEFPGGKIERGEDSAEALARELHEELGIDIAHPAPWLTQRFVYPHAHVELRFFRVYEWRGEPHPREGQAVAWQVPGQYTVGPLLPANTTILEALELPAIYGITMASEYGVDRFLELAEVALASGLRLVQVRERSMGEAALRRFLAQLVPLAHACRARVLVDAAPELAREAGADGVHLSSHALRRARVRPDLPLVAASCHDAEELAMAAALPCDFAVLSPVAETPLRRGVRGMGWTRFAERVHGTALPVYALGGLSREDLGRAMACGAHGVALRRRAWD